jgi:ubiquinone/menaquinone biosynthesis C-methylase UbiE
MTFDKNWDLDIYKKRKQINKHPYDKIVSSINRYFNKKKSSVKKLTALDLGCGTGNNTKFLCEYGFRKVIGIDGSRSAIKFAKRFLKKNKNCELFVGDFNNLNFIDRSIGACIDRGSITHNSKKNIDSIILEVYRILKRNSIFISCLFSKDHYAYQKKKNLFFKKETGAKSGLVTSFFDKNEIKKLFKNFKTEIIIHEINFDIITNKKSSMWFVVVKKI